MVLRKRVDFRHLPSGALKLDNHVSTKSELCCFHFSHTSLCSHSVAREKLSQMQEKEHVLNEEGNKLCLFDLSPHASPIRRRGKTQGTLTIPSKNIIPSSFVTFQSSLHSHRHCQGMSGGQLLEIL